MYLLLLKAHIGLIVLSFFSFALRAYWGFKASTWLMKEWPLKVHKVITLVMLISAIALCLTISQYPFADTWVAERLLGLVAEVGCAQLAFKPQLNRQLRMVFTSGDVYFICDDFLHRRNTYANRGSGNTAL
ncbi:SirB2 family protein [Vibrio vulnificus]|uniref:SirB2 family protein n=1 Tax=Vibrio vulnificus TaxID=672 RepID=UPI001EEA2240|nr:SirB2 family protein [Vibrio vulnificus]MCG6272726.1 SirB2 family protein [Vibrio vulnificus]